MEEHSLRYTLHLPVSTAPYKDCQPTVLSSLVTSGIKRYPPQQTRCLKLIFLRCVICLKPSQRRDKTSLDINLYNAFMHPNKFLGGYLSMIYLAQFTLGIVAVEPPPVVLSCSFEAFALTCSRIYCTRIPCNLAVQVGSIAPSPSLSQFGQPITIQIH